MSSNKYEEIVRKRSEEMLLIAEPGLATGKHSIGGRRYALQLIEERIAKYTPLARLSILREAEAFKTGIRMGIHGTEELMCSTNEMAAESLMTERGLIPPQTETT